MRATIRLQRYRHSSANDHFMDQGTFQTNWTRSEMGSACIPRHTHTQSHLVRSSKFLIVRAMPYDLWRKNVDVHLQKSVLFAITPPRFASLWCGFEQPTLWWRNPAAMLLIYHHYVWLNKLKFRCKQKKGIQTTKQTYMQPGKRRTDSC